MGGTGPTGKRMSTTTTSHYLAVREDWLAQRQEEILEPGLPIVDPHHHLWDRPGWRYLLDEILADTNSGHNITATVFVQCRAMHRAGGPEAMRPVGETEFVNGIAAMSASGGFGPTRIAAGIVGHADLTLGEAVRPVLEAHIRAGGGRFRGIRHIATWDPNPGVQNPAYTPPEDMLDSPGFRAGFAQLAPLGLSYDAWCYYHQLPRVKALAEAFPGTRIILNHVGGPLGFGPYENRREEVFAQWSAHIRALAACPNVTVKVGGMGMRTNNFGFERGELPPSSAKLAATWKPYAETVIEAFGAGRCMFESNFPVDKGSYSYQACWNAFKRLAACASAEEKAALFSGTATRIYRLEA